MPARWLRRWWSRQAGGAEGEVQLPEALWQATLQKYPYLNLVDSPAQRRLRLLTAGFLQQKEFHGAGGLLVTDAMAVAVAAQACLLLVGLASDKDPAAALAWYDDFVGIVLHPGEVLARREIADEAGVVHAWSEALTGEAMEGGPVMLSWADVADAGTSAAAGYNVVMHEFAHKIDMRDGAADGCPPLPRGFLGATNAAAARQRWMDVLDAEFQAFRDQVAAAERFAGLVSEPWMDSYGAESPSEFFAVATEAYFVRPEALRQQSLRLHDLLKAFFHPARAH